MFGSSASKGAIASTIAEYDVRLADCDADE